MGSPALNLLEGRKQGRKEDMREVIARARCGVGGTLP